MKSENSLLFKRFKRKILNNGVTVLFEKRELPIVSVAFAVKNGGINEKTSEKGISHFIEHLLYKGTKKRNAKQIAETIEKNGGDLNGFTSELLTAYWCKMPSKKLDIALDVLTDMIKNPLFDEKEMEKERKVIFEEIKMHKDNPMMHVFEKIQENLFTGTMGMNLAGTFETMKKITREKLIKKFEEVYTPNNLIISVVGDADFNKIAKFIEENFKGEKSKIKKQKFSEISSKKIEKRKGIDQANLVFAYHVPKSNSKKSPAAAVLSVLMAGGMSSRLFSEIREKRNLAYAVKGGYDINKDFAFNYVYVGTNKKNVNKVKEIILKEFEKVSIDLTKKELNEVKNQIIGNYQISVEDSQNQMVNLLSHEANGNAKEFYNFPKKISRVKMSEVKELAKKATKKYSFFALIPE